VAIAALLLMACELTGPSELASLESLSPVEIEPGERLTITGAGFVVGRAELILEGTLSAPGQVHSRRREERLVLSVLATSPTTASARLGRRHFQLLEAGHTTFIGRAILRFPSAAGENAPPIIASLDAVRLEFFASPTAHQAAAHLARERGQEVLDELGLEAGTLPEARGLLVRRVDSGSIADRAGLDEGDVIVSSGALTVASQADMSPPPGSRRMILGLRDREGGFRRVACRLERQGMGADIERIAALAMALSAAILMLVAAGPLRGPFRWLRVHLVGDAAGPRELLRQLGEASRERPVQTAVALLLFAAAPFLVMATSSAGVVVVMGLVILTSLVEAISTRSGWRRLGSVWIGLIRVIPLALASAVAAAQGASIDLDDLSRAQGLVPWRWIALSNPGCLLLLVLVVSVSCSRVGDATKPVAALQRGVAGALAAAVLLGGWSLSPEQEILGQMLFAAKGWMLGALLSLDGHGRGRALLALPLAGAGAAAALALTVLPLPEWVSTAAAWTTGAAAVFWVLPWWVSLLTRPPRPPSSSPRRADQRSASDQSASDQAPRLPHSSGSAVGLAPSVAAR
jgi:hypothetical protein